MMKNTRKKNPIISTLIGLAAGIVLAAAVLVIIPSVYEHLCKTRVYSDLEENLDDTIVSANIIIVLYEVTEETNITDTSISYPATGVIFDRDEQYYYVLTAAHVVDSEDEEETNTNRTYYILHANAPSLSEASKASEDHLELDEYCELLPLAEIEYISEDHDIAILKFQSGEELATLSLASEDSVYGDRIITVGKTDASLEYHYGKITSRTQKTFATDDGRSDQVLYTNAYDAPGYSGGAILNENMEIAGITVGGGTDFLGHFRYGAFLPVSTIADEMNLWKAQ